MNNHDHAISAFLGVSVTYCHMGSFLMNAWLMDIAYEGQKVLEL